MSIARDEKSQKEIAANSFKVRVAAIRLFAGKSIHFYY